MKKTIALLMVLCITASLFAIGSVKVGPAFSFVTGKTRDFEDGDTIYLKTETKYKSSGFGFDISGKYELDATVSAWADFGMVFCAEGKYKSEGQTKWQSVKEMYESAKKYADANNGTAKKKLNILTLAAGAAVRLSLATVPVDVSVGGGLFLDRMFAEVSVSIGNDYEAYTLKATNIGIAGYAEATYMINTEFGVGITMMPHIGLLNFTTMIETSDEAAYFTRANGFAFSFAMPIVIGVSYNF